MTSAMPPRTLRSLLASQFARDARQLTGGPADLDRLVRGVTLWLSGVEVPQDPDVVVVCPVGGEPGTVEQIDSLLRQPHSLMLLLTGPGITDTAQLSAVAGKHVVIHLDGDVNPAEVILAITRADQGPEEAAGRRLASLQRSLSQSLSEADPIQAITNRLRQVCNATIALVDRNGRPVQTTGPAPIALLFGEVSRTSAESQMVDVDGWHGVAARVSDPGEARGHLGWLVAVSRRMDFPDAYVTSAVHMAATLVEAAQRMAATAQGQERAVRAAVLQEALALRREPHVPELAGRISSLGLAFSEELRVAVVQGARRAPPSQPRASVHELADGLSQALRAHDIVHLDTVHDGTVVLLLQCSTATFRRTLVAEKPRFPAVLVGVGRQVGGVAEIADSHNDALLALRSLRHAGRGRFRTFEDFDLATRLFADVGIDKMVLWAQDFLGPVLTRATLIEGLRAFFEHNQNINAASESLSIHHNSLRYRLSKVEQALDINLHDPGAVAAVYLGLIALDLGQRRVPPSRGQASTRGPVTTDESVSTPATEFAPPRGAGGGAVPGPNP